MQTLEAIRAELGFSPVNPIPQSSGSSAVQASVHPSPYKPNYAVEQIVARFDAEVGHLREYAARYDLSMATCGAIATRLDEEMLAHRFAIVYPLHTALSAMPAPARTLRPSWVAETYFDT